MAKRQHPVSFAGRVSNRTLELAAVLLERDGQRDRALSGGATGIRSGL
jgi:hypothetical protein